VTIGALGRAASVVALCSAVFHLVVAVDERGSVAAAAVMIAFAALCGACVRPLWTRPERGVWISVATMYGAMLSLHAGLALAHSSAWAPLRTVGEATHPDHRGVGAASPALDAAYLAMHAIPVLQLGICLAAMASFWLHARPRPQVLEITRDRAASS
jgi:hypothetical protein